MRYLASEGNQHRDIILYGICHSQATSAIFKHYRQLLQLAMRPPSELSFPEDFSFRRPFVVDFTDIAIGGESFELQLEEIRVAPDSILVGKTLIAAGIRREWGVMIIAIKKHSGQMLFNPPSDTAFAAEDILITLGEQPATQRLERVAAGGTVHG